MKKLKKKKVMSKSKLAKLPTKPAISQASPAFHQQTENLRKVSLKGTFVSFKRSLRKIYPKDHLIKVELLKNRVDAAKFVNNAVEFRNVISGRVLNGIVKRIHGNSGVLMVRFKEGGLSAKDVGSEVLIKLYKIQPEEIY